MNIMYSLSLPFIIKQNFEIILFHILKTTKDSFKDTMGEIGKLVYQLFGFFLFVICCVNLLVKMLPLHLY